MINKFALTNLNSKQQKKSIRCCFITKLIKFPGFISKFRTLFAIEYDVRKRAFNDLNGIAVARCAIKTLKKFAPISQQWILKLHVDFLHINIRTKQNKFTNCAFFLQVSAFYALFHSLPNADSNLTEDGCLVFKYIFSLCITIETKQFDGHKLH